jgi:hypothetical protein
MLVVGWSQSIRVHPRLLLLCLLLLAGALAHSRYNAVSLIQLKLDIFQS